MYRRPPTYLIIASKIVRPASIYQVSMCVDGDNSDDDKRTKSKLELLIIALKKCTFKSIPGKSSDLVDFDYCISNKSPDHCGFAARS